jgi:hypothetical protein
MKSMTVLLIIGVFSPLPAWTTELPQKWESPAGANSMAADLKVHGDHLYMTWIERAGENSGKLFLAVHNGDSWSEPELVYASDSLFINWVDTPAVAVTDELRVVTWLEMLGDGLYDYGVRYKTASTVTGKGWVWSEPRWLHDDRSAVEHGFVSLAPLDHQRVLAIWLDGREMKGGHGSGGGNMQLRSRVIAAGGLGPEELIDDQTCECCATSLIKTRRGFSALYRDKTEHHIRDIHLARRQGGRWHNDGAIHKDNWEIQGCPVNGPVIIADGGVTVGAWFTSADQRPRIQVKVMGDSDAPALTLEESAALLGRLGMVAIHHNRIAVSWVSIEEEQTRVSLAILERKGNRLSIVSPARKVAYLPEDRWGGVPRPAMFGDWLVLVHQSDQHEGVQISAVPAR